MKRALLWTVPAGLAACGIALWLSSRMRTESRLPPPATLPFRLDARLEFREDAGGFVFHVSGTTTLPAETALRARIHAVESVPDWRVGIREDEEPLVCDDEEEPPRFRPQGGAFAADVATFRRRPYSLRYRARVLYRPQDQDPEVRRLLGDDEFSFPADLRLGHDTAFARELKERHGEARTDLFALEELWKRIRTEIGRQKRTPDEEAWRALSIAWKPELEASEARNRERFGLWCVWPERQMKMRLGGIAELLRRILDDQAAGLAGDPERAARVEHWTSRLPEHLEETREAGGIDSLDADVFRPLIARYEGAVAGLPATRTEAIEALLECAPPLQSRRRAYARLNDVGYRLARLLERPDPPARDAHDRSLAAFKSLAGLD